MLDIEEIEALLKETNYYNVLNVAENATTEEIRLAYRGLIRKYHPDAMKNYSGLKEIIDKIKLRYPDLIKTDSDYDKVVWILSDEISKKLNEARSNLKNPEEREKFDRKLKEERIRKAQNSQKTANDFNSWNDYEYTKSYTGSSNNSREHESRKKTNDFYSQNNSRKSDFAGQKNRQNKTSSSSKAKTHKATGGFSWSKNSHYYHADFTSNKTKPSRNFGDEFMKVCYSIANKVVKVINDSSKKYRDTVKSQPKGYTLGFVSGVLVATILFNVFSVNNNEKMEEPIIPDTTITTEIENDVTTPNITYEEPIIIEDETYELMEYVTAKYGDSLWDFEQRYGVPVDKIKMDNGLTSDDIFAGVDYKIIKEVDADELESYSVNYAYAGETISDLARKFNTNEETILNLNKDVIDENGNIEFGTTIVNVPDLDRSHSYHR